MFARSGTVTVRICVVWTLLDLLVGIVAHPRFRVFTGRVQTPTRSCVNQLSSVLSVLAPVAQSIRDCLHHVWTPDVDFGTVAAQLLDANLLQR